jgi:transposase
VYAAELTQWLASATASLADPSKASPRPQAKPQDGRRIKEQERNLLRKDQALAETLALLVLSEKISAISNKGEDA